MLTVYRPPPKEAGVNPKKVVPAGATYLTKVNGKLVMARAKKDKTADVAFDLLGEAFGANGVSTIRKKAKSISASTPPPLLIGGIPYVPQQQLLQTAPMPQTAFPPPPAPAQPFYIMPPPPPQPPMPLQTPYTPQGPYYPPCPPQPTPQDFEHLKHFDAHFNRYVVEKSEVRTKSPNKVVVEETKTTVTITKHICANCGRVRSKGYHKDHPLKDGDSPTPTFCRRCQRDASSTSSDSRNKKDKKKHKKHRSRSRVVESKPSEPEVQRDSTYEKVSIRIPRGGKVVTLEELSSDEDGRQRRRARRAKENRIVEEVETYHSRGRSRERGDIDDHESRRPPLSPLGRASARGVSPFDGLPKYYDRLRHSIVGSQLEKRHRSPSVSFRYVPGPSASRDKRYSDHIAEAQLHQEEYQEKTTTRKIPIHFFDDDAPRPMASYVRTSPVEHQAVSSRAPSREHSFDGETISSTRSQEASQRRRQEHRSPPGTSWGPPHDIHAAPGQTVVVTEKRVYRPKSEIEEERRSGSAAASRQPSGKGFVVTDTYVYRPKSELEEERLLEEERRRHEYADRAAPKGRGSRIKEFLAEDERMRKQYLDGTTVYERTQTRQFSAKEDAARYYHEDWAERNAESISSGRSEAYQKPYDLGNGDVAHYGYQDATYVSNISSRGEPRGYRSVPADEAARYFREDWDKRDSGSTLSYRGEGHRGYRRDSYEDSELAESDLGYRRESFYQGPPRVPSPPSPIPASSNIESWVAPPFSPRTESITTIRREEIQRGKAPARSPSNSVVSELEYECRTTSQHRPTLAREVTESSLERALILSPRNNSRESIRHPYHVSEMTERVQEVDDNGKRVKFREEISEAGTTSDWTTEEISMKGWPENRSVHAEEWETAETAIDRGK